MADSRIRNCCPECGSVSLFRRKTSSDYVCRKCRWTGRIPNKKILKHWRAADSQRRIAKLAELHAENPEISKTDLRRMAFETDYMIDKYWGIRGE